MLRWRSRFVRALLVCFTATIFPPFACALDPNRAIAEAHHDHWGFKQGFPGGAVNAIAQTTDGYLWLGTQNGLVRFDGERFTLLNQGSAASFPEAPVLGLRSDRSGGLWIRLQSPGLFRYHDGRFQSMLPSSSDFAGVTALGTGVEGDVLLARFGDPLRFKNGALSHLLNSNAPGQLAISIEETSDGTFWIGTRDAGLLRYSHGHVSKLDGLPDRKVNCLLRGTHGSLWIGTDSGLARWTGSDLQRPPMPESLSHAQVLSLAGDRDGNLWIGTSRGLARIDDHGNTSEEPPGDAPRTPVNAVFEDREGNLWVGRSNGIDRYRDTIFQTYPTAFGHESENGGPLCMDAKGRLWFGPSAGGLSWLRGARKGSFSGAGLPDDVVYSIASGPGELWVGRQKGGLTHLLERGESFKTETFTTQNGLAKGPVYVVHRSHDGSIWAGTGNGGISRLQGGRITTYTTRNGLASNAVTAIQETDDGTIWVATLNGLMSFANGIWQLHSGEDGLPPARVNCLFVDSKDVLWIGTEAGLAFSKDGRMVTPPLSSAKLQGNILGIVDDGLGYFWIAADHYVIRASRASLLGTASNADALREFDISDGLPGSDGVRRDHSVLKDGMGRIWFSLQEGIAMVNPARVHPQSPPALVHVEEIAINGRGVNITNALHVPPSQQRIAFSYIGLSLGAPENVQYRYRLDGFDHEWTAASRSRQAVYTNLNPGAYRFRVISSNSEGIWNSTEANLSFQIDSHIWQRLWFQGAAIFIAACALVAIYQFRLRQLTNQLNVRFEERLGERTRIARELHDTLLQSLHGLMFRFQAARNMLPRRPEEAMKALDGAITRTEQAIAESRDAIKDLRGASSTEDDIAQSIAAMGNELGGASGADQIPAVFSVTVEGQSRPVSSIIQDEARRIAHEVLTNAFRHAEPRRVEAEIRYDRHSLRLRFRDDGKGIHPDILKAGGRPGHWGLPGIRERAHQIGAQLDFWSEAGAGTEVQLTIPAIVAYSRPGGRRTNGTHPQMEKP